MATTKYEGIVQKHADQEQVNWDPIDVHITLAQRGPADGRTWTYTAEVSNHPDGPRRIVGTLPSRHQTRMAMFLAKRAVQRALGKGIYYYRGPMNVEYVINEERS